MPIRLAVLLLVAAWAAAQTPPPPGRLVDLGGHKLHVHCAGKGNPTVVVENGLGDFSFDWVLVQNEVAKSTRICTYDRAGYAWSDLGPMPRTFAQMNLELHDALAKLGERGPFVLAGHSFGGPVIRWYASLYPDEVAGVVQVDAAEEDSRYTYQGKAILIRASAQGKQPPPPHEEMRASDQPPQLPPPQAQPLEPLYLRLPKPQQELQKWAQSQPAIEVAENSQREWSAEYLQVMHDTPQAGSLGARPLIVLTRAEGGYGNDLDMPAAQLEKDRREGQAKLARLSSNSRQVLLPCGHNMEIEAPADVAAAILEVALAVRNHAAIRPSSH